jgi:ubiquinone/menaquinone biosynthesis C-methylase UbiE
MFLHGVRDRGHTGRLCGLDPAVGMLEQARKRTDVEWVLGELSAVAFDREFELVVMSGHAFQVFVSDDELRAALAAIRAALTDGGRFAFETRNPLAGAWERWTADYGHDITDADGVAVRYQHVVDEPFDGRVVHFTSTYTSPAWDRPETSTSTLRFLDNGALHGFLAEAGLSVDEQFGDWDGSPLTDASTEIITFASR